MAIGKRASGAPQKLTAQSGHDIHLGSVASDCPGTSYAGTLAQSCTEYWKRHITFTKPFKTIPKVVVA